VKPRGKHPTFSVDAGIRSAQNRQRVKDAFLVSDILDKMSDTDDVGTLRLARGKRFSVIP